MSNETKCFRPGCEGVKLVKASSSESANLFCPRCLANYGKANQHYVVPATRSKRHNNEM